MRTLIILGHPDKKSLCSAIADSYEKGACEKGGEVERINLHELNFNINLNNNSLDSDKLKIENPS